MYAIQCGMMKCTAIDHMPLVMYSVPSVLLVLLTRVNLASKDTIYQIWTTCVLYVTTTVLNARMNRITVLYVTMDSIWMKSQSVNHAILLARHVMAIHNTVPPASMTQLLMKTLENAYVRKAVEMQL